MRLTDIFASFPQQIAHRGLSSLAPENTLEAFAVAARAGYSWIECDVKLSADDHPMLFHDDYLSRTTDHTGLFVDYGRWELQSFDAGSWFSDRFKNACIPTLRQALLACNRLSLGMNLEIKPNAGQDTLTAQQIEATLKKMDKHPDILLSSFSVEALQYCQEQMSHIPRALLRSGEACNNTFDNWMLQAQRLNCVALHIEHKSYRPGMAQQCHQQGLSLLVYTVNQNTQASTLLNQGVTSIFTDITLNLEPQFNQSIELAYQPA
ncbi:glycerophosphodiester phosphodiesterase family protein [Pleionea sp. CnH1-48]|uniref:glycerophosphodiester phosphodiesterase family protein n=1 Tax=Pleionea sp. CnH1-48 TaxID=2954494 RepID=UPI002097EAC1|nr:glycerophosphodiester phosphodiesterase family protein [Pleionea sp. CnH1-48]MCO7224834.1 hypothetical protein [Pleionea sp. CnH1-48]